MAPKYPEDCLQAFTSSWWNAERSGQIARGRLIWTLVPYPGMKPYRLVPTGRGSDARQHTTADYRIETFRIGDPRKGIAALPIAALPIRDGESLLVTRGKRRPAVVISTGGVAVSPEVRQGASRWQSAHSILVAPYYGADPGGTRGGWPAPFVERIRRAEYPQYVWDILPTVAAVEQSILRLDHIMPIGADPANWTIEPWVLSAEALGLIDESINWMINGTLTDQSGLGFARNGLAEL